MRKTLNQYLEEKGLSIDALKETPNELVQHINDLNKLNDEELEKALEGKADAQEIAKLREELGRTQKERDEQFALITKAISDLGVSVQKGLTLTVNDLNKDKSFKEIVEVALEDKKDELLKHAEGLSKDTIRIRLKAATDPLLQGDGLGTVTGNVPQSYRKPGIVDQRRRESLVRNWITTATISRTEEGLPAVISWVEQANIEETTAPTAEGAVKNDIHWEYEVKNEASKCITTTTTVSTHMLRRVGQMAQRINFQLTRSIDNECEQQIYFGDNVGQNLNGIFTQGTPFAAPTALALTIPDANNYDAIRSAINQVRTGSSGTINAVGEPAGFMPTVVLMNDTASAGMDLSKGSDSHYVLPPFVSADGTMIKNIPIITTNHLGEDQFLVMEGPLVEFWTEMDIMIEVGWVNNEFKSNLRTVVAEMCGLLIIPDNQVNGVVFGDFTTAKAALETP